MKQQHQPALLQQAVHEKFQRPLALKETPIVVRTFARKGNDDHKLADQVKLAGLGSQMGLVLIFPLSKVWC